MTMPDPAATPTTPLDQLLMDAGVRIRNGQYAEAKERVEQAKALAPDHPAVLELEGDLLFAQGRFKAAEGAYFKAFKADNSNARLEEKYATAIVKASEPVLRAATLRLPDDDPWNFRVPRPPWASALFSLLFPGLGQFYNGDLFKGGGIVLLNIIFWSRIANAIYFLVKGGDKTLAGFQHTLTQGANIVVLLLMAALTLYSAIDAYLVAREENGG